MLFLSIPALAMAVMDIPVPPLRFYVIRIPFFFVLCNKSLVDFLNFNKFALSRAFPVPELAKHFLRRGASRMSVLKNPPLAA